MIDTRLGVVTWLLAAAHEVPQELGDFGILIHSWDRRHTQWFNVLSALTFRVGSLIACGLAERIHVAFLIPFAAGNFIYIATADLLPELTTSREWRDSSSTPPGSRPASGSSRSRPRPERRAGPDHRPLPASTGRGDDEW